MYAMHLPPDVAKALVTSDWNLGDVFITDRVLDASEDEGLLVEPLLFRHFGGDYGLISEDPVDSRRIVAARLEGRSFTSLFRHGEELVKVVTHPAQSRTVVCLACED